ncbi:YegP family protein [Streptacidiphilus sp. MAP5-3]|jgi:uncharacterized protein YegP (UPF0339 family)|uniref:YegP family protein n=1 Tax=unclassified Streptacidiphilus TaxID=2643834 RepID=UPI0035197EEB
MMARAIPHFEVWQGEDNEWRRHLKAAGGEILAEEKGFDTEDDAGRACDAVKRPAAEAHIIEAKAA